jgi:hypothetical protein
VIRVYGGARRHNDMPLLRRRDWRICYSAMCVWLLPTKAPCRDACCDLRYEYLHRMFDA